VLQVEDPDICPVAVPGRDEGETRAVGRESGGIVDRRSGDQGLGAGAVKAGAEDVRLTRPIASMMPFEPEPGIEPGTVFCAVARDA
jgi:hypothetical protein